MKTGKISETILKRTVLKQIHTKRSEVLSGAGIGMDGAIVRPEENGQMVFSAQSVTGTMQDIATVGVIRALNNLAALGAQPIGILNTLVLPERYSEAKLKKIIGQIEAVCAQYGIQNMGGHTSVSSGVTVPVISITAVGQQKVQTQISAVGVKAGMDILITKWVGLEGTVLLAREKETELCERYAAPFIDKVKKLDIYLPVLSEAAVAVRSGVGAMHDASEGGIFGALWSMAQASGVGLDIDLKKIPIRQETIEISEFFNLNPYELQSGGSLIMAAEDGNGLALALQKAGIPAVVVGKATAGKDRILWNEEEKRYLELPKQDEICRFFA